MMTTAQPSITQLDHALPVGLYELAPRLPTSWPQAFRWKEIPESSNSVDSDGTEDEIVEALSQGDDAAFRALIDRYHTRLLRLARTYVRIEAVAEEVVQETWLAILEGIGSFEARSSLKTWIYKILINRAKTRGLRESRYVTFSRASQSADLDEEADFEPERFLTSGEEAGRWAKSPAHWDALTPERLLLSREGLSEVEKAIQTLPKSQRQVIILHDVEGVESEEVCRLLNITQTNQRVLLHRARSKVRRALNAYLHGHCET